MTKGDLLSNTEVEAIVNAVNIFGAMGKGIALAFKIKYPQMYQAYKKACEAKELQPGKMHVYDLGKDETPRFIINFPTKRHWRDKSRLEDIKSGLLALVLELRNRNIKSIAIPALGCKNGGLNWDQVRPFIQATFKEFDNIKAVIYEPQE
jgi:O-acetyl-ADP-ribose deacetylase (regulator of RNase III)